MVHHPRTRQWAAAVIVLGAVVLSGCSPASPQSEVRGAMIGIGSSGSQYAVSAWADSWTKSNNAVSLQFSADGATVGKEALFAGNTYFAALDGPLNSDDITASTSVCGPRGAFSVPATVVPLGITYNLGGVTGLRLDAQALAGIYSGTITSWRDPIIVAQNAGRELPNIDIVPIYATESSVVNAVFTTFLADAAPQTWAGTPSNIMPEVPGGNPVAKFSTLGTEVDNQAGSIAFMDDNLIWTGLPTVLLKFGDNYVEPTKASLQNAVAAGATTTTENVVTQTLGVGTDASYPLAAVQHQAFCFDYPEPELAELAKSWGKRVLGRAGQDNSNTFASTTSPSPEALQAALQMVQTIAATK